MALASSGWKVPRVAIHPVAMGEALHSQHIRRHTILLDQRRGTNAHAGDSSVVGMYCNFCFRRTLLSVGWLRLKVLRAWIWCRENYF